ncbi:uncharacterized protein LOC117645546 [Thrips palmi]|uniref:Uncharacterized protein LOC117645546 n=1 Tax=Thrips palmi TaxID=161013 RepID=A0A6P8ZN46_THRPL|nr:uncharacterized protein LOC117645546 [Thrips palmi]
MFAVILVNFYTSRIVGTLLSPVPRTIHTVEDLIRSPLQAGLIDNAVFRNTIPDFKDKWATAVYEAKILHSWPNRTTGGFFSVAEGVARVQQGGFAFATAEALALYQAIERTFRDEEKCSLAEVDVLPPAFNAPLVRKKSPFKEHVNYGLLLMYERGLVKRSRLRWSMPKPYCESETNAVAAVGLDPIFPAHGILLLGIVTSSLFLVLERCSVGAWPRPCKRGGGPVRVRLASLEDKPRSEPSACRMTQLRRSTIGNLSTHSTKHSPVLGESTVVPGPSENVSSFNDKIIDDTFITF